MKHVKSWALFRKNVAKISKNGEVYAKAFLILLIFKEISFRSGNMDIVFNSFVELWVVFFQTWVELWVPNLNQNGASPSKSKHS